MSANLQDAMSFSATLDLSRLLLFQAVLATVTAVSKSPSYNLPLILFGIYATEKGPSETLRSFAALFLLSLFLDFWWLTSESGVSTLAYLLILIGAFAKPVTLLAVTASFKQQGLPTMGSLGVGGPVSGGRQRGTTVWSADDSAGYHQASTPYQTVGDLDDEEDLAPAPAPKASNAQRGQSHVRGSPSSGGGYHTIGA